MDLDLSPRPGFRDEVRAFLAEHLTPEIRDGAAATPSVFVEPDIGQAWNAVLNRKAGSPINGPRNMAARAGARYNAISLKRNAPRRARRT
jgi:hypothetical protein